MLDAAHRLTLRGVAKGIVDKPTPAVAHLIESGLVAEAAEGYVLTDKGREALDQR